jgi:hypothetical protein
MGSEANHCITCKEYYEYKENLCSNCYKFKTAGVYSVVPNRESKLLNELQCKYINSKNLSFLIKLVTNNLSITCDEIYNIIQELDIYMTYNNVSVIYNLLKTNDRKNNVKLNHILSHRILDFWNNRLGGPSCYYDNYYTIPNNLKDAEDVLKINKRNFLVYWI